MLMLKYQEIFNWRSEICIWIMDVEFIGQVKTGDTDMEANSI